MRSVHTAGRRTPSCERLYLVHELLDILEVPVYRCESDVRDRVDRVQDVEYHLPENRRRDLMAVFGRPDRALLNLVDHLLDLQLRDRTLSKRLLNPFLEFCSIERFSSAAGSFDHHELFFLNPFVRRVPVSTREAFAASPDALAAGKAP